MSTELGDGRWDMVSVDDIRWLGDANVLGAELLIIDPGWLLSGLTGRSIPIDSI